ncbi:hypothetical protein ACJJTC_001768 [Scirpophaga incertulas]
MPMLIFVPEEPLGVEWPPVKATLLNMRLPLHNDTFNVNLVRVAYRHAARAPLAVVLTCFVVNVRAVTVLGNRETRQSLLLECLKLSCSEEDASSSGGDSPPLKRRVDSGMSVHD